eukprot:TRINITY_DN3905_c1_g1_i6.p1 TRINITY_DN3905_c1_g1~~TRINITY_DN3905_c1_g1_i6.p1  ORF type:complete len:1381 (+),score=390.26 TRINITY_DN3905_c1_g1_i6:532-4674(+)
MGAARAGRGRPGAQTGSPSSAHRVLPSPRLTQTGAQPHTPLSHDGVPSPEHNGIWAPIPPSSVHACESPQSFSLTSFPVDVVAGAGDDDLQKMRRLRELEYLVEEQRARTLDRIRKLESEQAKMERGDPACSGIRAHLQSLIEHKGRLLADQREQLNQLMQAHRDQQELLSRMAQRAQDEIRQSWQQPNGSAGSDPGAASPCSAPGNNRQLDGVAGHRRVMSPGPAGSSAPMSADLQGNTHTPPSAATSAPSGERQVSPQQQPRSLSQGCPVPLDLGLHGFVPVPKAAAAQLARPTSLPGLMPAPEPMQVHHSGMHSFNGPATPLVPWPMQQGVLVFQSTPVASPLAQVAVAVPAGSFEMAAQADERKFASPQQLPTAMAAPPSADVDSHRSGKQVPSQPQPQPQPQPPQPQPPAASVPATAASASAPPLHPGSLTPQKRPLRSPTSAAQAPAFHSAEFGQLVNSTSQRPAGTEPITPNAAAGRAGVGGSSPPSPQSAAGSDGPTESPAATLDRPISPLADAKLECMTPADTVRRLQRDDSVISIDSACTPRRNQEGISRRESRLSNLQRRMSATSARGMSRVQSYGSPRSRALRWRRGRLVGTGAFGTVHCALNEDTGDLMAVKNITLSCADQRLAQRLQQLRSEIDMMKTLSHPNIVQYRGTERGPGGSLNIFMEYVAGGSIAKLIQQFGALTESVTVVYTEQVLEGLAYLHEHNAVHRDIKGANLLLTTDGVCKLADFGAATYIVARDEVASQLSVCGTPNWMAPEVITQHGHDFKADIWSLGCTVMEMLTGQPPWAHVSTSSLQVLSFIAGDSDIGPGIRTAFRKAALSDLCVEFVLLCLRRVPAERPTVTTLLGSADAPHPWLGIDRDSDDDSGLEAAQARWLDETRKQQRLAAESVGVVAAAAAPPAASAEPPAAQPASSESASPTKMGLLKPVPLLSPDRKRLSPRFGTDSADESSRVADSMRQSTCPRADTDTSVQALATTVAQGHASSFRKGKDGAGAAGKLPHFRAAHSVTPPRSQPTTPTPTLRISVGGWNASLPPLSPTQDGKHDPLLSPEPSCGRRAPPSPLAGRLSLKQASSTGGMPSPSSRGTVPMAVPVAGGDPAAGEAQAAPDDETPFSPAFSLPAQPPQRSGSPKAPAPGAKRAARRAILSPLSPAADAAEGRHFGGRDQCGPESAVAAAVAVLLCSAASDRERPLPRRRSLSSQESAHRIRLRLADVGGPRGSLLMSPLTHHLGKKRPSDDSKVSSIASGAILLTTPRDGGSDSLFPLSPSSAPHQRDTHRDLSAVGSPMSRGTHPHGGAESDKERLKKFVFPAPCSREDRRPSVTSVSTAETGTPHGLHTFVAADGPPGAPSPLPSAAISCSHGRLAGKA